ncbi:hypothetical protein FRT59_09060 [Pseudomonas haemolytica]|uniref:Uncharacterized protein n=1 Tax=Pseudomonas haemolytica TaxID=2600065 RepID=A0A5P1DAQ4_9PSED|nr:hypothetical protein [Pseudomonas haemolytica]
MAPSLNCSVIGFSSLKVNPDNVHELHRSDIASVFDGGCAQGTFGCAGFVWIPRSTNLRTAATLMFSS